MRGVIAILIALALAGCTSDSTPDPTAQEDDVVEEVEEMWDAFFVNATGTAGAIGAQGTTGEFEVPNGTGRLTVNLLWQTPAAQLSVQLSGPGDEGGLYASPGDGRVQGDIPEPTPGTWSYTVQAQRAASVPFTISFFVAPDDTLITVLEETVTVPANSFFEINTQMDEGARINWEWTADAASDYNVHTHFDNEVQYLVQETATEHSGSVVQNRTGGLSLMWEVAGNAPIQVTYKAWGEFEVDSYFPPR